MFSEIPTVAEVCNAQTEHKQKKEEEISIKKAFGEQQEQELAELYKKVMIGCIKDAIKTLMNSGSFCTRLNIDENFQSLHGITTKFHVVHYGGKPIYNTVKQKWDWYCREKNPMFEGLFKELQTVMLERGYYLLDISDPTKSFGLVIKLYLGKPDWYDESVSLWHGFNKVN